MKTGETVSRELAYQGHIFSVRRDRVLLEDGVPHLREVVEHGPAVCVLPVDGNGDTVLVEQYRHPVGQYVLEACAGGMEPEETPFAAAVRELKEETGLVGRDWRSLGAYLPSPGYCDEVIHLFFCRVDRQETPTPDGDEFLSVRTFSLEEAARMVLDGRIQDGKTVGIVLKVQALSTAGRL